MFPAAGGRGATDARGAERGPLGSAHRPVCPRVSQVSSRTLSSTPLRAGHLSPAARPPALGASSCPSGSGFGFRPERGEGGVTKQREQQGPPVLGLQGGWPGGKACLWLLTSPVHCLWELTLRPEIDLMGGKTSLQGS